MKTWIQNNWLKLLAIVALAGAVLGSLPFLGTLPFVYYQLMNWIVVGAGIVIAMRASHKNNIAVMWLFILVAVVFNPIAPLYLSQDVWRITDMVAGGLFFLALFL